MPKVALADTLVEWDSLIAAARRRVAKHPEIVPVLEALESLRDRSKALKAERESLQARRQVATQELKQAREEGKDFAIRLRSALKSALGTQNEALVEFNVRPRRPYGPRKKGSPR
jgi:seryl-tRNA synthetase